LEKQAVAVDTVVSCRNNLQTYTFRTLWTGIRIFPFDNDTVKNHRGLPYLLLIQICEANFHKFVTNNPNVGMSEIPIQTRSKVGRSSPAGRKLFGQTKTVLHKKPVRTCDLISPTETSIVEFLHDSTTNIANRGDNAIMKALTILTHKIDDLKLSVTVIKQEIVAIEQELKGVFAL
jgi:hypothetical protein